MTSRGCLVLPFCHEVINLYIAVLNFKTYNSLSTDNLIFGKVLKIEAFLIQRSIKQSFTVRVFLGFIEPQDSTCVALGINIARAFEVELTKLIATK